MFIYLFLQKSKFMLHLMTQCKIFRRTDDVRTLALSLLDTLYHFLALNNMSLKLSKCLKLL